MRMQEPEQYPVSETTGRTAQEYGTNGLPSWAESRGQKIDPHEQHEARLSILLSYLIIGFSVAGFGAAVVGLVGCAIVLGNQQGSRQLLAGGILGLVSACVALVLFVVLFVLALVSETRRKSRRS